MLGAFFNQHSKYSTVKSHTNFYKRLLSILTLVLIFAMQCRLSSGSELLIITPAQEEAEHRTLQESIDSQLIDYDITSNIHLISKPIPGTTSPLVTAEKYQTINNNFAVLWLNEDDFFLYIHDGEDSHFFTKPLPISSSSWELQCDAIASAVHAVISSWVEPSIHQPQRAPESSTSDSSESTSDTTPNSNETASTQTPESNAVQVPPFQMGLGVVYNPHVMSSANPWVNGAGVLLVLQIQSHLQLSIAPGFAFANAHSYRLSRIPVRMKIGAVFDKAKLQLGVEISTLLESTRIRSKEKVRLPKGDVMYWGVGAAATFSYRIHKQITLLSLVGLDVFQKSNTYRWDDQVIFQYGPVQGNINLGIIFWR